MSNSNKQQQQPVYSQQCPTQLWRENSSYCKIINQHDDGDNQKYTNKYWQSVHLI